MKVLFYRYNSICEQIYINAMKTLGIEVLEECTEIANKNITQEELLKNVETHIKNNKLLFVISINYYPVISAIFTKFHM